MLRTAHQAERAAEKGPPKRAAQHKVIQALPGSVGRQAPAAYSASYRVRAEPGIKRLPRERPVRG